LPFAVHSAREIGAIDAVFDALVPGAAAKTACAATGVHDAGFASVASQVLFRHVFKTVSERISTAGFAVHYYRARTAVDSAVGIGIEFIHCFSPQYCIRDHRVCQYLLTLFYPYILTTATPPANASISFFSV
jgi:hypothetical protein